MQGEGGEQQRAELLLAHPLVVLSLIGWIVNDHVLKERYHNAFTGKLTDVFAMILFPLLVAFVLQRWNERPMRWAIVITIVFYSSINLFDVADQIVETTLSTVGPSGLTKDPTDLVTLPLLAIPVLLWRSPRTVSVFRVAWGRAVFGAGVVACLATSAPEAPTTEPFRGSFVLDADTPQLTMPLTFTLDGEPASPMLGIDLDVTAFGSGPEPDAQFSGHLTREVTDTRITFGIEDDSWLPAEVAWEIVGVGLIGDSCGVISGCDQEIPELVLDAPENERLEPDVDIDLPAPDDRRGRILIETRLRILDEDVALHFPKDITERFSRERDRAVWSADGRRLSPSTTATPIPIPPDCVLPCDLSLWSIHHPGSATRFSVFGEAELLSNTEHKLVVAAREQTTVQIEVGELETGERSSVRFCVSTDFEFEHDLDREQTIISLSAPGQDPLAEFAIGERVERNFGYSMDSDQSRCDSRSQTFSNDGTQDTVLVERVATVLRLESSNPPELELVGTVEN